MLLWQVSHAGLLMVFSSQMAQQNSFDIVSQVDSAEVTNALNQTLKEVRQRFDFKGSTANVVLEKNELVLSAEDETKLRNMNDILQQKLVRRGVPLKAFSYGNIEPAAGGTVRQTRDRSRKAFRRRKPKRLSSSSKTVRPRSRLRFRATSCAFPATIATHFRTSSRS